MTDKKQVNEQIELVLKKHFPDAFDHELKSGAMRIILPLEISTKAEYTREWKALINNEIQELKELQKLTGNISNIIKGLHSATKIQIGKALAPLDEKIRPISQYKEAMEDIATQLKTLKQTFSIAEEFTKERFSNYGIEKGRKRNDSATMCAYMAGITFFILKNKRPTVVYNAYTEEAGGPFLKLVSDIFITLKLNASAEACAKKAVKSIKEETHPIIGSFLPLSI
ncbi:MAG: hypothetical protein P8I57_06260 [Amylibacter sp.]|nr:hypothetical protein [Amylibacter sp.]|tara:strand:+ start:1104 stop:1781 length:678 start_codon:yes stop_codon:yes gene_type:complete